MKLHIKSLFAAAAILVATAMNAAPFKQGEKWLDTQGNPINAHGAGMLYHNGKYYLYGEYKKGETILPKWATWECYRTDVTGVSCYSSPDLENWTFEGVVLPASTVPSHDLHKSKVLERPKVVYNAKTGKFVMWAHVESADYSKAAAGVAVADSPTGPFKYLGSFRPNDAMSRDQTVFVDDDGKAYQFASSEENQTMYINELTDDYLRPTGRYTRNFIGDAREAPAVFKRNGKYYMLSSGCTGWDPNNAQIAVADSIMGPWTVIGDPCVGPDADKTFYAQSTYVQPVQGKKDCYLAMFDRWKKKDLEDSRYVWLPIVWDKNDKPTIPWQETTSVAAFPNKGRFFAGEGSFMLNGKPMLVKAAELHYPRIPADYWEHRILMSKALGMNTICLYVFWNAHEPKPDQFDFTGQNDLRKFIKLCDKHGMKVILRPGPYVCAEWEMGGLPWWLLKNKNVRLREDDPYFLDRVNKFQKAVADQVSDLTVANGGPIIMVQVENEYGSYGKNKKYVGQIRDMLRKNFGPDVTLFQCDWSSNFLDNGLNDLIWTLNFGSGADVDAQFAPLKKVRPNSPLMCSEYWSGWFDKWGANHETRTAEQMLSGIDDMLAKNISFSLYMTHGGTNWGHWAGANSPGFAPDVTSYDYDAPISEWGTATPKYHALRKTLAKYAPGEKQIAIPAAKPIVKIAPFMFTEVAPLFANLPEGKQDKTLKTMEEYDQGFGSILYTTSLPALAEGATLNIDELHDYGQIFIDGKLIGVLDRRYGDRELILPAVREGAKLEILVEAMGRINFGRAIKDFKGITKAVTITEVRNGYNFTFTPTDWTVYNLPDEYSFYTAQNFEPVKAAAEYADGRYPRGVYRAKFKLNKVGDTFLNFETWGKGLVYVNGHAMGRFWGIGPQQTLYMPGCWLKKGENEILVYDIAGPQELKSEGLTAPILDKLPFKKARGNNKAPELAAKKPAAEGAFAASNGWKEVRFDAPAKGRYVAVEAINAQDGGNRAAIAEFYVLDDKGERISRERWTVDYVSSEDVKGVNNSAEKTYDLQESTYWQSAPDAKYPYTMVLDLGREYRVSGIQALPRMDTGAPGAIKNYRIFVY